MYHTDHDNDDQVKRFIGIFEVYSLHTLYILVH